MDSAEDQDYNFLLVGITGAGKSSTANSILLSNNNVKFKVAADSVSVTQKVQEEYGRVDGRVVKVVDVPGLADHQKTDEDAIRNVVEQISKGVEKSPEGYDAILIVITYGRLHRGDLVVVSQLKQILGDKFIAEYGVLLITRSGDFDPQETDANTIEEWCSKQEGLLKDLRQECRDRVVFFENKHSKKEEKKAQLEQLFQTVDEMKFGPKRYTPELFKEAQEKRDLLLKSATKVYLSEEIRKEIGLIRHDVYSIKLDNPDEDIDKLEKYRENVLKLLKKVEEQDKGTGKLNDVKTVLNMTRENVDQKEAFAKALIKQSKSQKEMEASISTLKSELAEERQKLSDEIAKKDEEFRKMKDKMEEANKEMEGKYQDAISSQEKHTKLLDRISMVSCLLGGLASLSQGVTGAVTGGVNARSLKYLKNLKK